MENSNNSMNKKSPEISCDDTRATNDIDHSQEESGWTMYLEDFMLHNDNDSPVVSICESARITDACSLINASKKLADEDLMISANGRGYHCNMMSFKKRKMIKEVSLIIDEDLEDTASSPVNSPKVSVRPQEKSDKHINMFEVKELNSSSHVADRAQRSTNEELAFVRKESDCMYLKKRSLCIVPLSMIVSYIG